MGQSLSDRQKEYEDAYDTTIIRRLPIIIRLDGRSFSKLTKKLPKPFCSKFVELMTNTTLELVKQIDGAVFAYQQSDEISIIVKNDNNEDTTPWFGNRIQKIASISASIATYEFNKYLWEMSNKPELHGTPLFDARVFAVPDIVEALNYLVFRQQDCARNAVTGALYAALGNKYGRGTARKLMEGKSLPERLEMLWEECQIEYEQDYPVSFRNGIGAYLVPKFYSTPFGNVNRNRWILDFNLPRVVEDRDFFHGIIKTGRDVFRQERDLEIDG